MNGTSIRGTSIDADVVIGHLDQFKSGNEKNQRHLQIVLKEYEKLLDAYKTLKSRSGEDVDKSSGYVMVLVDGNGYLFNDELMKQNEEGGMKAACMLNDVVEKYLYPVESAGPSPRIIIRVYADTKNLTQTLGTLSGGFAAGFTRGMPFTDFADSLDVEGTKCKLKEMLNFAINDSHCAHILYAACHNTSYLKHLAGCLNLQRKNKVTLVQGSGFKSDFYQLGLPLTQFSTVFRWTEQQASPTYPQICLLNDNVPMHQRRSDWRSTASPTHGNGVNSPSTKGTMGINPSDRTDLSKVPCHFFAKGHCKNGSQCRFLHGATIVRSIPPARREPLINPAFHPPSSSTSKLIPINKDNQRVDEKIVPPTKEDWATYTVRYQSKKICSQYHLQGSCKLADCPFDHTPLERGALRALAYVVRGTPCPRKSACRKHDCPYGHTCPKLHNGHITESIACKFGDFHGIDANVKNMVAADAPTTAVAQASASGANEGEKQTGRKSPTITSSGSAAESDEVLLI